MKKDNKNRNSSLSKVELQHLQYNKLVSKHRFKIRTTYAKSSNQINHINLEEGC